MMVACGQERSIVQTLYEAALAYGQATIAWDTCGESEDPGKCDQCPANACPVHDRFFAAEEALRELCVMIAAQTQAGVETLDRQENLKKGI